MSNRLRNRQGGAVESGKGETQGGGANVEREKPGGVEGEKTGVGGCGVWKRKQTRGAGTEAGGKGFDLVPATFLGSKAVDRRALLAGVRSRIHMPAIRYSIVSSWLVRPITSANMARQLLSKAAAYTSNNLDYSCVTFEALQ